MKKPIPTFLCMLAMSQCLLAQAAVTDPTAQAESAKLQHQPATAVPATTPVSTPPSTEKRVSAPPAIALPDAFDSAPVSDANAYDFAKTCTPDTTLTSFNKLVADVGDKMTASVRPTDKSKPYLVVTRGKAYCIRMSDTKYAIIPPSAFDKTMFFPGMDKEERNAMHADLARQLAARGTATATVVGEQGYVFVLTYLYASARPVKMYYHATFMKYDGTQEGYVGNVYKTPGPFSEFTYEQGGDQESVKYFFSK